MNYTNKSPTDNSLLRINKSVFQGRYIKGDGGQIEMTNGDMVDVSRSKKEEFLKIIK